MVDGPAKLVQSPRLSKLTYLSETNWFVISDPSCADAVVVYARPAAKAVQSGAAGVRLGYQRRSQY
jgi:hypothetical protein